MKKLLTVIIGFLFFGGTNLFAINPINLGVHWGNDLPIIPGHGKSPIQPPSIWQDDYQIFFNAY